MLSLMSFTLSYAIFYAIYPKLCYFLRHIPHSSAIFFLNVMLQYIILTPRYANSSYAMFSGQRWVRISGYCCMRAGFLLRCQNSLRWEICLICHWNIDSWKQKLSFGYVMVESQKTLENHLDRTQITFSESNNYKRWK